jgi:hypothetical protein
MTPKTAPTRQTDRFSWHQSFYAYLIYRGAPLTEDQLVNLALCIYPIRGHADPIDTADEMMLSWPFDVTE